MAVTGFSFELESPVNAARIFKAAVLDSQSVMPKAMPQVVSSASLLQGDGGVGSVKQFKFTEIVPLSHVNQRIDVLDETNLEYKYTVTEGSYLGTKVTSALYHIKIEPSAGGSICKASAEYETTEEVELTEEEINIGKDGLLGTIKAVEAFLLANPDAYA
ncbi:major strawberry allergen Fra a 1-3-like [Aristolochia californica]|uniref:major strawberry allergen Fra a 1-3-like n=1 Tax=Aristolochia californica TaxID=171875 RepID=UPI0035D6CEBF